MQNSFVRFVRIPLINAMQKDTFPFHHTTRAVLLRLSGDSGLRVGDLDTERLGLSNDFDSLLGGNSVGDLGSVGSVVHEE